MHSSKRPAAAPKIESLDDESEPIQDDQPAPPPRQPPADQQNAAPPAAATPPSLVQSAIVAGNLAVLVFSLLSIVSGGTGPFRLALFAGIFINLISLVQIFGVRVRDPGGPVLLTCIAVPQAEHGLRLSNSPK